MIQSISLSLLSFFLSCILKDQELKPTIRKESELIHCQHSSPPFSCSGLFTNTPSVVALAGSRKRSFFFPEKGEDVRCADRENKTCGKGKKSRWFIIKYQSLRSTWNQNAEEITTILITNTVRTQTTVVSCTLRERAPTGILEPIV